VKTFLMKVFLMFSAMACMFQGIMLLSVGLGRLSPQKLVVFYDQLLNFPAALKTIEIVGAFFVLLGFILLVFAARTKQVPKIITVEQEGQSLNIDYRTVIDFIEEVGSQDPYVTHFLADFINTPKEGIIIPVEIELNGVPSVHHVLIEMENTLRSEIENVFGLKKIKFDFHVKGVSIDPKKKYFASHAVVQTPSPVEGALPVSQEAAAPQPEKLVLTPDIEKLMIAQQLEKVAPKAAAHEHKVAITTESNIALEERFSEKRTDEEMEQLFEEVKKDSNKSSLVSRILWGK